MLILVDFVACEFQNLTFTVAHAEIHTQEKKK